MGLKSKSKDNLPVNTLRSADKLLSIVITIANF